MQAGDGHHRARLRRHVRRHRVRERRRHPGRSLLERADRGRAGVRAEGAARGPGLHARRRAARDRLRRAGARGAQLAHRARGPHHRRHDRRQRRLRRDGARRRRASGPTRSTCAGCPALLYRNGEIEETGVAAGVLGHPATGVAWLANKFHQHGARLEAGEIILAGSFTRPMWVSRGDSVLLRLRTDGRRSHAASSEPAPSATRSPPPSRPLAGIWVCSGSPLVAEICAGAGLDWVLIDMEHSPNGLESVLGAAAGRRRLPGHAGRARADRRRRDDQAGARPRRAEPPRADGVVRRGGARRRRGRALSRRAAARGVGLGARALGALEPRRRLPRGRRRPRVALRPDRDGRRAWMPRPTSPRSTASTGSSSGRPTSRRRWVCSGSRRIRMSSPPCCAPSTPCARAGKPVGVNAFDPAVARSLPRRRRVVRAGRAPTSPCSRADPRPSPPGSHLRPAADEPRRRTDPHADETVGSTSGVVQPRDPDLRVRHPVEDVSARRRSPRSGGEHHVAARSRCARPPSPPAAAARACARSRSTDRRRRAVWRLLRSGRSAGARTRARYGRSRHGGAAAIPRERAAARARRRSW